MELRARKVVLAFVAAAVALLVAPGAAGQPRTPRAPPLAQSLPPDARRDYDAGKLLFEDGDYSTALLKFQAAYDRTRDPRLLWNVAVCQKNLRRYALAATTLARYAGEGGDLLSPSDRRDAQELSRAIAPFVIPTTVHVSEPDAQVWIDDALVGRSPLPAPVPLDMGTRRVRVEKAGYRVFERELPVGGSAATTVEVVLERQTGHVQLNVPADATVSLDEHEVGQGPRVELDVPVGMHAVRVQAPGMRSLQTDLVVEDGASRVLDLALQAAGTPTTELHVSVTCMGRDPVRQEALFVFLDGATESALSLGNRSRREPGHEAGAYVAYRIEPGHHRVHVASPHCEAQDTTIDVAEGGVADVKGSLRANNHWLEGSPAGSPDGWVASAGLVTSATSFSSYQNFFANGHDRGSTAVTTLASGLEMAGGLQGRWLLALGDARLQVARVVGAGGSGPPSSSDSTLSQWSLGVRAGVRVPLYYVTLIWGVGAHLGQYVFTPDSGSWRSGGLLGVSGWQAVDIQPFCEWGAQLGAEAGSVDYGGVPGGAGNGGMVTLWASISYAPNTLCTRRRAGRLKIEGVMLP
jgi:hypothetical protein